MKFQEVGFMFCSVCGSGFCKSCNVVGSECAEFFHSAHILPINPSRIIHVCSMVNLIYGAKMLQSFKN